MYAISQCSVARINLRMSSSYRLDREAALLSVTTELCNQLVIAVAVATMTSADLHINYIVLPLLRVLCNVSFCFIVELAADISGLVMSIEQS